MGFQRCWHKSMVPTQLRQVFQVSTTLQEKILWQFLYGKDFILHFSLIELTQIVFMKNRQLPSLRRKSFIKFIFQQTLPNFVAGLGIRVSPGREAIRLIKGVWKLNFYMVNTNISFHSWFHNTLYLNLIASDAQRSKAVFIHKIQRGILYNTVKASGKFVPKLFCT